MAETRSGVSGVAIAAAFAGGIFLWSGIKGYKMSFLVQDLISGKNPQLDPRVPTSQLKVTPGGLFGGVLGSINPLKLLGSGGTGNIPGQGSLGGTQAQNQALGKRMAAAVGWTGPQWVALNNLVMGESGWSSTIKNPTSSASGIAQNINGFGPGYQSGNAGQQIAWLIHYIQTRPGYGDPVTTYNLWLSRSPHWY
jgi:hypothetical protein